MNRRQQLRVVRDAGFKKHRLATSCQFGVIARYGKDAVFAAFKRNGRNMCAGWTKPRRNWRDIGIAGGKHVVERHHAVGQIATESANVADRKQFHRSLHRNICMGYGANT